jgi:predicted TIM-barrel fold metal-dependent hydrolase
MNTSPGLPSPKSHPGRVDQLVDVHSHFLPPVYVEEAIAAGHTTPDGIPAWPQWTVDAQLRLVDTEGIDRSVLSLSLPGVHFGQDAAAIALAHRVNDVAAELQAGHPDRFQFFACLPLRVIDASLLELTGSLDELGAPGVVLETNSHGQYLSHPDLEPVWAALDEREATVFVHPTSPPAWERTALALPRPMLEFRIETMRTIVGLVMAGVLQRHRRVRVTVPHAGQRLPAIVERVELFGRASMRAGEDGLFRVQLGRLWFDLAATPMPRHTAALVDVVGPEQIVYGSDYCLAPPAFVTAQIQALDEGWNRIDDTPWRVRTTRNAQALLTHPHDRSRP